jgi:hypothetical protein
MASLLEAIKVQDSLETYGIVYKASKAAPANRILSNILREVVEDLFDTVSRTDISEESITVRMKEIVNQD